MDAIYQSRELGAFDAASELTMKVLHNIGNTDLVCLVLANSKFDAGGVTSGELYDGQPVMILRTNDF